MRALKPIPRDEVVAVALVANGWNPHPCQATTMERPLGLESLPCQLLAQHLSNEFAPVLASSNQLLQTRFDHFFIHAIRTGGRHDGRVRIQNVDARDVVAPSIGYTTERRDSCRQGELWPLSGILSGGTYERSRV